MQPPSPIEEMIVTAARLIPDGSTVLVGTQWPILTTLLAKSLYAPQCTLCFEGGVVLGKIPDRVPLFTGDPVVNSSSVFLGSSFQTLGMILHRGKADLGVLSAAAVDRYGNINTTCFGAYDNPRIRLGGAGGACDFGCLATRTIIILEHDKRRFPEHVDFITTPGYLKGGKSREEAGLRPGTGPYAVITTLGLFHFNEEGEMFLAAHSPSTTPSKVKEAVQWDLKISDQIRAWQEPTVKELEILRRRLDPQGMYLKKARLMEGIPLPF
jgi:glutaconate CoA-transferase subunit B